ncbi:uncharacterized protein LOC100558663 [Anolis carolinensis]|uniref:uncharacterized protein LOC100558663 n=1 Tax=Anolis carolinensis TaxID=28377 RepID=UPI0002038DA8|nr:PREDICTED: uncharacterized protein LOC100558663 [Anolis carolinensis]|eukprot:XP_003217981.1 PREDICTED: uncharacterized protein LOC100558663 [Anolis carolinensis]
MKDSSVLKPLLDEGDHMVVSPEQTTSDHERLLESLVPLRNMLDKDTKFALFCFCQSSPECETARSRVLRILTLLLIYGLLFGLIVFALGQSYVTSKVHTYPIQPIPREFERIKGVMNITIAVSGVPKNLTLAALLEAKGQEPHGGAMKICLDKAAQEFSKEPAIVKKNALMAILCNGTKQVFRSGKGQNKIGVVLANGKVYYVFIHGASAEVHLARLGHQTFPLNRTSILDVLEDLKSQNGSEEMQRCLNKTLSELPREPTTVPANAKMVVSCGGQNLTFLSGTGKNEIHVYREETGGEIQFRVKTSGWDWWARVFTRGRVV